MTKRLMATDGSLFRTLAAIRAPCSVKARGKTGENFNFLTWSQIVTTSAFSAALSWKRKSVGNRLELSYTA